MNYMDESHSQLVKDLKRMTPVPESEVDESLKIYKSTKDIQHLHKITLGNMGFIIEKAKKFGNRRLPVSDLIAAGTKGVERAAVKFDHGKGVKFSTYASFWIEMYMRREVIHNRSLVRISPRTWEISLKVSKLRKSGDSDADILNKLRIRKKTLNNMRTLQDDISLNSSIQRDTETDADFCDMIPDSRPTPYGDVSKSDYMAYLERQMLKLSTRERDIIARRFGIDGRTRQTLKELSDLHGISPERVRQILVQSLARLKLLMGDSTHDEEGTTPDMAAI